MKHTLILLLSLLLSFPVASYAQRASSKPNLRSGTIVGVIQRTDSYNGRIQSIIVKTDNYVFDLDVLAAPAVVIGGDISRPGTRVSVTYRRLDKSEMDANYYTGTAVKIEVLTSGNTVRKINVAAHNNWNLFWSDFRTAVRNRDRVALRAMMSADFSSWYKFDATPDEAIRLIDRNNGYSHIEGILNKPFESYYCGDQSCRQVPANAGEGYEGWYVVFQKGKDGRWRWLQLNHLG
jgi:hypothetical protein